jgi:hypothetical protein
MMELCYPEIQYVPRTTLPFSSDFHSECWNILDPSSDHSDTISESHLFDTDPTPKSLDSPNPTIFPHVDNRSTLERCLAEILRADELEQSNFFTSAQPVDLIQITHFKPTDCTDEVQTQTPENINFHQVNQASIPSDSIPDYPILSESESLFHLSSTPEFDIEELNDEDIHDLETIFQTFGEPSINPYLLDFMIQNPSEKTCVCLEGLFNDNLDTHTHILWTTLIILLRMYLLKMSTHHLMSLNSSLSHFHFN